MIKMKGQKITCLCYFHPPSLPSLSFCLSQRRQSLWKHFNGSAVFMCDIDEKSHRAVISAVTLMDHPETVPGEGLLKPARQGRWMPIATSTIITSHKSITHTHTHTHTHEKSHAEIVISPFKQMTNTWIASKMSTSTQNQWLHLQSDSGHLNWEANWEHSLCVWPLLTLEHRWDCTGTSAKVRPHRKAGSSHEPTSWGPDSWTVMCLCLLTRVITHTKKLTALTTLNSLVLFLTLKHRLH